MSAIQHQNLFSSVVSLPFIRIKLSDPKSHGEIKNRYVDYAVNLEVSFGLLELILLFLDQHCNNQKIHCKIGRRRYEEFAWVKRQLKDVKVCFFRKLSLINLLF